MDGIKTLREAVIYFADFENCRKVMSGLRWPDGKVKCPTCGSDHVTYLANARVWKCYGKHSRPKFSLKTGTIFEDSPLGLDKWLPALWLIVNCKNGISSCEVARDLGVTQKTGWFMLHRIRYAMQGDNGGKLDGEVEVDETFIGGKARNMHKGVREKRIKTRGPFGKAVVMAVLERHGEVRPKVIPDTSRKELRKHIEENVHIGADVFTDAHPAYKGLDDRFAHQVIDHAVAYVDGQIHTNGLENFWSLLKRGLSGTYVSVEPFHLFRYVDEQAFRYNNRRDMDDFDRFELALSNIVGRRFTYKQLIGQAEDPQPQSEVF